MPLFFIKSLKKLEKNIKKLFKKWHIYDIIILNIVLLCYEDRKAMKPAVKVAPSPVIIHTFWGTGIAYRVQS